MTTVERLFLARLRRRAQQVQPALARRELAAYEIIRRSLSEIELTRAIVSGQVEALIAELLSDQALDPAFAPLRELLDQSLIDAGRMASRDLPSAVAPAAFNFLAPEVVQAARDLNIRTTTALKVEVREAVRKTVIDGIEAGKGPRTVATRIVQHIGLSPQQVQAVENFRNQLQAGDRAALSRALARGSLTTESGKVIQRAGHAGGRGLSARDIQLLKRRLGTDVLRPDQIDRMVEAYRRRLQAWNAESHARAAALQAQKAGQRVAWDDAVRRGVVEVDMLRREWIAVGGPGGDGRNRPEHLDMHGEVVRHNERFSNGQLDPGEGDYNCRCVARTFLARRQREVAA